MSSLDEPIQNETIAQYWKALSEQLENREALADGIHFLSSAALETMFSDIKSKWDAMIQFSEENVNNDLCFGFEYIGKLVSPKQMNASNGQGAIRI